MLLLELIAAAYNVFVILLIAFFMFGVVPYAVMLVKEEIKELRTKSSRYRRQHGAFDRRHIDVARHRRLRHG